MENKSVSMHVKGNKKYKVVDLPIAATFVSKNKSARIVLEPVESRDMPDGTVRIIPDSGLKVVFIENYARIGNKSVLEKLISHPYFNGAKFGFFPDKDDPTGFWEALGIVHTKMIPEKEIVPQTDIKLDKNNKLTSHTIAALNKAMTSNEEKPKEETVS